METSISRIASVKPVAPTALVVRWQDGGEDHVELAGWIATGGQPLAPLADEARFALARVGTYGAAVEWEDDGDLAIDATHLAMLAREQQPFKPADLAAWQAETGLSNQEAADFIGTSLSTWNAYKAGSSIPSAVGMLCRATRRDPILLQAHYRPRKTGRPRKAPAA